MASTNFVDYVKIFCRSGAGGPGSMHLHRDKRSAKGGPDGGNGGRGGHVILKGNRNYWTLIHLKYQRHVYAEDGESGSGNLCTGADGQDVIIDVPLGTVARDALSPQPFLRNLCPKSLNITRKWPGGAMPNSACSCTGDLTACTAAYTTDSTKDEAVRNGL